MQNKFEKLKILALGPQNVFPPTDGGKEGIFGALCALSRHADINYAFPHGHAIVERGYIDIGVIPLPMRVVLREDIFAIIQATLKFRPYKFQKYSSKLILKELDRLIGDKSFDAIICHHPHTFRLAEALRSLRDWDIPIILREHNIEHELVKDYCGSLNGLKKGFGRLLSSLTKHEEQLIWSIVDGVAFLSDYDYEKAASSNISGNFILAREGIPLADIREISKPSEDAPLVILLNPNAAQSLKNLKVFIEQYWRPLIESNQLTNETLYITGVTSNQLADLIGINLDLLRSIRVIGLGFLPTLDELFRNSLALISPTFIGGGIRKKILEAMSNWVPVIATQKDISSCSYFSVEHNILKMENPLEFRDAVLRLRSDMVFRSYISKNARETVENYASWDHYGDVMIGFIARAMESRSKIK